MSTYELMCEYCKYKGFENEEQIEQHQLNICSPNTPLVVENCQPNALYLCFYCNNRVFKAKKALKTHMNSSRCNKNQKQSPKETQIALRRHSAVTKHRENNPNKSVGELENEVKQLDNEIEKLHDS